MVDLLLSIIFWSWHCYFVKHVFSNMSLLFILHSVAKGSNSFQTSCHYNYEADTAAVGTVLKYFASTLLLKCLDSCQNRPDCVSFNVHFNGSTSSGIPRLYDIVSCEFFTSYVVQLIKTPSTYYYSKITVL